MGMLEVIYRCHSDRYWFKSYKWSVGTKFKPTFHDETMEQLLKYASVTPVKVNADGPELDFIRMNFKGLPDTGRTCVVWRDLFAEFIVDNLYVIDRERSV
jgi:hypothetical protein